MNTDHRARAAIIAVVDDDPRVLDSLEILLQSADYEVRLFESPVSFMQNADLTHIDCLISDVAMPVMTGFELMREARKTRPELPVIFVSGRSDVAREADGSHGDYRFFRKPFDGAALLLAVDDVLRGAQRHIPNP